MPGPKSLSLWSWALYDFANTIFSAVVLTAYFPLYLTSLAGANWYLGVATTGSMVIAGLVVPFFGALSDQTGKTKSYLIKTTLACIFAMLFLALTKTPWLLILFFIVACFFYHASLVFYNALLVTVAQPGKQGQASGLGTGLGYLGVVCALPVANLADKALGRPMVFAVAALLFLLFALPAFFFVPERKVESTVRFRWGLWFTEWRKIIETVKGLRHHLALALFLGGNFFVVDALNSTIFWFMVYGREVFHPGQDKLVMVLTGVNCGAFLAGLVTGRLTDRLGALRVLCLAAAALVVTLILLAWVPSFALFVAVSVTTGAFAIAGIWTAGRKALIDLCPAEKIGEYFGIYGLTTKISVLGSLLFSIIADQAGFRMALSALLLPAGMGFGLLLFSKYLNNHKMEYSVQP
ncbi:MAG: MFS transporter [Candidatus Omnitrophica bacterium]|nr:MFS transporter [Candidatus Omnitrophota bacterium]